MPHRDKQQDSALLQELIDAIARYERRCEAFGETSVFDAPSSGGRQTAACEEKKLEQARATLLETLEGGLLGLSYDRLGLKIRIAMVLAKACRLEEEDFSGLRIVLEDTLAYDQRSMNPAHDISATVKASQEEVQEGCP